MPQSLGGGRRGVPLSRPLTGSKIYGPNHRDPSREPAFRCSGRATASGTCYSYLSTENRPSTYEHLCWAELCRCHPQHMLTNRALRVFGCGPAAQAVARHILKTWNRSLIQEAMPVCFLLLASARPGLVHSARLQRHGRTMARANSATLLWKKQCSTFDAAFKGASLHWPTRSGGWAGAWMLWGRKLRMQFGRPTSAGELGGAMTSNADSAPCRAMVVGGLLSLLMRALACSNPATRRWLMMLC